MTTKTDNAPTGLDRFNALLAWWGTPNEIDLSNIGTQTKHFQILAANLSQAFGEASTSQMKTLITTNERLARSLQEILHSQQPAELMAAHSNVVAGLLESLAAQTKVWADLTQKLHDCCATVAREAVAEVGEGAERPASKEIGKRAARG